MGKKSVGKDNKKIKKKHLVNKVIIVMGSDSDLPVMKDAAIVLEQFSVPYEMKVVSAHRTPEEMVNFAKNAIENNVQVIIAGAGGAAHLPGMIASLTSVPVIGVPVPIQPLSGTDSLLSIVQMPKGVPVATVAIGNSWNAGLLAVQILGHGGASNDRELIEKLKEYKESLRKMVLKKKLTKPS